MNYFPSKMLPKEFRKSPSKVSKLPSSHFWAKLGFIGSVAVCFIPYLLASSSTFDLSKI